MFIREIASSCGEKRNVPKSDPFSSRSVAKMVGLSVLSAFGSSAVHELNMHRSSLTSDFTDTMCISLMMGPSLEVSMVRSAMGESLSIIVLALVKRTGSKSVMSGVQSSRRNTFFPSPSRRAGSA